MTDANISHFERLNAYIDGELSPAEQAEFEQLVERDADLRRRLEELRSAERDLRTVFAASAPERVTVPEPERESVGRASPLQAFLRFELQGRHLAGLAAAVLIIAAGWLFVRWLITPVGDPAGRLYSRHTFSMQPDHVCTTPEAFVDYTVEFLNEPVTANYDTPVELVGWVAPSGYRSIDDEPSRILLARAPTGEPVIVLFQTGSRWEVHQNDPEINIFRDRVGEVRLTELTPLDRPVVLDLIAPAPRPPTAEPNATPESPPDDSPDAPTDGDN